MYSQVIDNDPSDPFHDRYGQHLTQAEVHELIAPHDESVAMVDNWLASYGFFEEHCNRSPGRDWVKVKVTIGLAEEMLDTVWITLKRLPHHI